MPLPSPTSENIQPNRRQDPLRCDLQPAYNILKVIFSLIENRTTGDIYGQVTTVIWQEQRQSP